MAKLSLPPIDVLAAAAAALVEESADNRARVNALNKAALQLHEGVAPVLTVGGFLVESGTRGGLVHRYSSLCGCTCESGRQGRACWHAAMIEIIEQAQMLHIPMTAKIAAARVQRQREAEAAMNELYI